MTEKEFTINYLKEFKKDWWAFKISDMARTIKPFDFFWINKDWVIFCEVKVIDNDIFDIMQLRNNQFTALEKITLLSEKYNLVNLIHPVVLIYSKKENKSKRIYFRTLLNNYNNGIFKTKIDFNK